MLRNFLGNIETAAVHSKIYVKKERAWQDFDLPLTTTSNEASKLFDANVTQYVGWYDDDGVGGIDKSLSDMITADPNFVMGHVIKNGLELLGTATTVRLNSQLGRDIYDMAVIADGQKNLTDRERKHVAAVKLWSEGQMIEACNTWEDILMDNPTDILAMKFAHDSYFYLGMSAQMRDSIGRTFPKWDKSMPLYGYLYGMYSFGLEETNLYPQAEKYARQGLEINPKDAWSTHSVALVLEMMGGQEVLFLCTFQGLEINPRDAWSTHSVAHVLEMMGRQDEGIQFMSGTEREWAGLEINPRDAWSTHSVAHVLEMMGRQDEGIQFMSGTEREWASCGMLACHNYWHWALHFIEKGDLEQAMGICDSHVFKRAKDSGMPLDTVDACSLLMRLEMEGANVSSRWKDALEVVRPHIDDHVLTFNDNHILLACLGAEDSKAVNQMMNSITDWLQKHRGDQVDITKEVGLPICEAFKAYKEGDRAKAVDILYPLRYKVIKIGGSHAQRDLYNLFLIQAAIKSNKPEHHKLARFLLTERKSIKPCSPMTDRLIARAMAQHAD